MIGRTEVSELRAAALWYVRQGWPVLPLQPGGKVPAGELVPHGVSEASVDEELVRQWWDRVPRANIGVASGVAFDVLDIDGEEGTRSMIELTAHYGQLPPGPIVVTRRGFHHYFAPHKLRNRAGIRSGVDIRGSGGYVVAPPSRHPSGASYRWAEGAGPRTALPPMPAWLRELARRPAPRQRRGGGDSPPSSSTAYGLAALEREIGRIALAHVGQRNDQLNRSAYALGRLIAGGELDGEQALDALLTAGERSGLESSEVRATVASGIQSGIELPRRASR